MKALLLTTAECLAGMAMLLLLIDHGLVLISLFVLTLFLREAAERERTHHLLEKQAAEWKETKRRLYLEVRHHEP